jgi:hypothetical protein
MPPSRPKKQGAIDGLLATEKGEERSERQPETDDTEARNRSTRLLATDQTKETRPPVVKANNRKRQIPDKPEG